MDTQRLTDDDFLAADAAPAPERVETTEADYPGTIPGDDGPPSPDDAMAAAPPPTDEAAAAPAEAAPSDAPPETPDTTEATEAASPTEAEPAAPDARYAELEAKYERERQQREALETEKHAREAQEAEQRLHADWAQFDQQYQQAKHRVIAQSRQLSDAQAEQFLARELGRLDQARDAKWLEVTQAREAQKDRLLSHVSRHSFYDRVIADFKLPQAARPYLEAYDPAAMTDTQLQLFVEQWQKFGQMQQQHTQLQREQAAQARIQSGADAMGGQRGGGGKPDPHLDPTSPDYNPVAAYHTAGPWVRSRL